MAREPSPDPASRLADDYLARVAAACRARRLPRRRAAAIIAHASRQLSAARAANPGSEAVAVLDAIAMLGEPDDVAGRDGDVELAYSASPDAGGRRGRTIADGPLWARRDDTEVRAPARGEEGEGGADGPPRADVELGMLEGLALLGITVGWLLPGPGWLLGAAALLGSRRWSGRDKALALIVPWLIVGMPFVAMVRRILSTDPYVVETTTMSVLVVPAVAALLAFGTAGVFLWMRLQPAPRPGAPPPER